MTTIIVASILFVCATAVVLAGWLFKDNLVVFIDSFTPKSELTLSVFDTWIDASSDHISLGKVTEKQAERLCGIGSHDTSCQWGEADIEPSGDYTGDFAVTLLASDEYLKEDEQYEIGIENALRDRTYRVFILHEDLLGRLNGINEVILTEAGSRNGMRIYTWDLSQVSGFIEQSETLPEGTYSIVAAEVETGFVSEKSDWFRVKSKHKPNSEENIAYAANTPLVDSYWDGRGVFFAGGESKEDTLTLVGDMEMYDIFRGVDFPEKNEVDTVVFVQTGGVVIVAYNAEFVNFDNREFAIAELLAELESNSGSIYRTRPFDVEEDEIGNENTNQEEGVVVVTPDNINEIIAENRSEDKETDWSVSSPGTAQVTPTTISNTEPAVEIVDVKLPTIFIRYENLPPVGWMIASGNTRIPMDPLESGGSGTLELTLPAAAFPGPGEYIVDVFGRGDSHFELESSPYYIELPERPEIVDITVEPRKVSQGDEVTLSWKTKNVEYCRIRDAHGKVFAEQADSSGSMTMKPESNIIFDFRCYGYDMSEYGFSAPNNRQWDISGTSVFVE